MSSNEDYIINPLTKRPIKRGSKRWRKLIKDGIIDDSNFEDEKIIYVPDKNLNQKQINEDLEKAKIELKSEENEQIQYVKGRGKYKNKLVERKLRKKKMVKLFEIISVYDD